MYRQKRVCGSTSILRIHALYAGISCILLCTWLYRSYNCGFFSFTPEHSTSVLLCPSFHQVWKLNQLKSLITVVGLLESVNITAVGFDLISTDKSTWYCSTPQPTEASLSETAVFILLLLLLLLVINLIKYFWCIVFDDELPISRSCEVASRFFHVFVHNYGLCDRTNHSLFFSAL